MNDAADALADRAGEGNTTRRVPLGAAHIGVERRELRRQVRRREAAGSGIGLAPVERSPEVRTARSARDARVLHIGARDYTARAISR